MNWVGRRITLVMIIKWNNSSRQAFYTNMYSYLLQCICKAFSYRIFPIFDIFLRWNSSSPTRKYKETCKQSNPYIWIYNRLHCLYIHLYIYKLLSKNPGWVYQTHRCRKMFYSEGAKLVFSWVSYIISQGLM